MTELDYLKCKLEDTEKAFDRLHKKYVDLLRKQGELEKENEQLKLEYKELRYANNIYCEAIDKLKKRNEQLKQLINDKSQY